MAIKAYQYRLYPTRKQITCLERTLESCRWVYNETLAMRKNAWEQDQRSVSYLETKRQLPLWKQKRPDLKSVHSQVLQDVSHRVELAYQAFFTRVQNGEKEVGYPRFKGKYRYDSISYIQSGFHLKDEGTILHLSKIGDIPMVYHRPIEGVIKRVTIRRTSTGKWYACFTVKMDDSKPADPIPLSERSVVGIDVGLTTFCTLSDGTTIENPRWFRTEEKRLAKAQRKFSGCEKGTTKRRKQRLAVARIHEKIANRRKDFAYKTAHTLTQTYDLLVFEDLSIQNMMKNHCLAKSIGDAAWNLLISTTINKAEEAGCKVVLVNPAHTTQMCSTCGTIVKKTLSDRVHSCPHCGLIMDRDLNASLNIMRLGLQSLANTA